MMADFTIARGRQSTKPGLIQKAEGRLKSPKAV